jgi:hypothetical protein
MSFRMESLTPEQYEAIYAKYDTLFSKVCVPQKKWDHVWKQRNWAVDPETDSRFMYVNKFAPNDIDPPYLVVYRGHPLIVQIRERGTANVHPFDVPEALRGELEAIRKTIRDAYAVHGKLGVVGALTPIPEVTFE